MRSAAWYTKGVTLDEPRSPRDAQRRRLYLAETPLPTSPLPGLDACAAYADRVVGTLWWEARFPDRGLGRVPGFRPGHGARQAFFTTDERAKGRGVENPYARLRVVAPGFFSVVGVPLIAGRDFSEEDGRGSESTGPSLTTSTSRPTDAPSPASSSTPPRSSSAPSAPRRSRRRTESSGYTSPGRQGSGPTAGSTTGGTSGCASARARPWPSCTRRVTAVRSRRRACTRATSAGRRRYGYASAARRVRCASRPRPCGTSARCRRRAPLVS